MFSILRKKIIISWAIALYFLLAGLASEIQAFENRSSGPNYFKLNKGTGMFHYDRSKDESRLKGAMWREYKKIPISRSDYTAKSLTFLQNAETAEVLKKETFTTKRGSVKSYYEEGGVGYAQLPEKMPEHTLTMYKVKILTGKSEGKEGWVYKDSMGPRTKKPKYQSKINIDDTKPVTQQPKAKASRKGSLFLVKLKSGQTIVSKVYKEINDTVTLMKGGKTINYPKSEIASIKTLK